MAGNVSRLAIEIVADEKGVITAIRRIGDEAESTGRRGRKGFEEADVGANKLAWTLAQIDREFAARSFSSKLKTEFSDILGPIGSVTSALSGMGGVLATLGLSYSIVGAVKLADSYTLLEARLKLVTSSFGELEEIQSKLFEQAQSSRANYAETANLYARLARSATELRLGQSDLLNVTDLINKSILISGATAQEASAGLIQFSQGLASGRLQGDELRSVLEQMPRLAKAIADGMDISIGALREMGAEGVLSASTILGAIQKSGAGINAEFDKMPVTVGQSMTNSMNSIGKLIDKINDATGATRGLASTFQGVSKFIDSLTANNGEEKKVVVDIEIPNSAGRSFLDALADPNPVMVYAPKIETSKAYGPETKPWWDKSPNETTPWAAPKPIDPQEAKKAADQTAGAWKGVYSALKFESSGYYDYQVAQIAKQAAEWQKAGVSQVQLELWKTIELKKLAEERFKAEQGWRTMSESQLKDYNNLVKSLHAEDAANRKAADEATSKAISQWVENNRIKANEMSEIWKSAYQNIQSYTATTFLDLMKGNYDNWGDAFGDMLLNMIANYESAQLTMALMGDGQSNKGLVGAGLSVLGSALSGFADYGGYAGYQNYNAMGAYGFADGGIMTDRGPLPLRKYAGGGIASSPQIAEFGEGSMREAFVPLPDGRTIPVTMTNDSGAGPATSNTFYVDMRGASIEAVQRLETLVASVNGSIEQRAVTAVANFNQRGRI